MAIIEQPNNSQDDMIVSNYIQHIMYVLYTVIRYRK
jgi:hypothetical protein